MYQALTSALNDLAWRLHSASQVVPISQISVVTWAMFFITGSFDSKKAFKAAEH
ncbi:MAG TPA: hypothetical protein VED22_01090 [Nitrososphaerales archaeon]|nr:hypothetical protein [Nitrososphaerales archaeon]